MNNPFWLASFDEWDAAAYLKDYYSYVEQDEQYTLKFLVEEFRKIDGNPLAMEFGIGPTLHHVLPLSPYVAEIHVADYLSSNLDEVRKWQRQDHGAHNWNPFTELVLSYEGGAPTPQDVTRREALTRERITRHMVGDASAPNPVGPRSRGQYDFVLSCYCADSATYDKRTWYQYMENIVSLLRPGGFFVTAALRNCRSYRVGSKLFPCANVNEHDFMDLFKALDFDMQSTRFKVEEVPEHKALGYQSIILVSGFMRDGRRPGGPA